METLRMARTLGECWVAGDGTEGECRRLAGGSSASGRLAVRGAALRHAIVKGGRVHGALKVAVGGVWTYDLRRSKAVGLPCPLRLSELG